jgi:hypothetical protein
MVIRIKRKQPKDYVEYISRPRANSRGLKFMERLGFLGEGWYYWIGGNKVAGPYSSYQAAVFAAGMYYNR